MTNGDKIRSMTDEELAVVIIKESRIGDYIHFCTSKTECEKRLETDEDIPDEWCIGCLVEWMKKEKIDYERRKSTSNNQE